jgi:tRNA pseudouridine38-40 synthase
LALRPTCSNFAAEKEKGNGIMQRYFIYLAYDGTRYHGWQVQPNGLSVQEVLTKALSTLLRVPTEITGAGRTDAGVHARQMVAHFDAAEPIDCIQMAYKLNRILPPDISVDKVVPVRSDAHARFDATQRTYHYFVHTAKSPFERFYSCRIHGTLDFGKMNEAAQLLLLYDDFTSFSKVHTDVKTNLCRISRARWEQVGPQEWRFEISANRFLRNMVRAIVGTLLEVGRGRLSVDGFRAVIEGRNRCCAGESVAANALFLVSIEYKKDVFIETSEPSRACEGSSNSDKM